MARETSRRDKRLKFRRIMLKRNIVTLTAVAGLRVFASAQPASITVHADEVQHRITPYLTGACIEDVNHEIYGGLDSQMIFGESFAEPAVQLPLKGFTAYDGRWTLSDEGSLQGVGAGGAKLVLDGLTIAEGEVSVDVKLTEDTGGNGGLILKVNDAAKGADKFTGYEVSLERPGFLVLGRHRQNWEPLRRIPCDVPSGEWIHLAVRLGARSLEVLVNGRRILQYEDTEHPLDSGSVGVRIWQHKVFFRNLKVGTAEPAQTIPFEYDIEGTLGEGVSGMWRPIQSGEVKGGFSLVSPGAFSGVQSQRIEFESGSGVIGIENSSLNHWGMNFVEGRPYEGCVYARSDKPVEFVVALENRDGSEVYAERALKCISNAWQRLDFTLTPRTTDKAGRFAIRLEQSGVLTLGYAHLQPGAWGRFRDLPVRNDVAEGLIKQGVQVLRYGGSMVNNPEYRWKKMIGPRAHRPPYEGHWYPYSSNGWGIFDFLNFCEAARCLGIPDLDINETPQDMADFMDYLNGAPTNEWGAKRVADGHPAPYRLKYIQLGNEERVDESYFQKFKALAMVIWAKDPSVILIVGDFSYHQVITDPFQFTGADSGVTTLAAHRKILQLAKQYDREVWFDLHVWTDGPQPDGSLQGMFSFIDALEKMAGGAKFKVVVFELNANNHAQRRALANALAINAIERDGRLPITCSANGLQPDGQNDNGWDQGLLFLNPSQVWMQPPGYAAQMISRNYQPCVVGIDCVGRDLDAVATRSEDGRTLVLQMVNSGDQPALVGLQLYGFEAARPVTRVTQLSGSLHTANSAVAPERIKPHSFEWAHSLDDGRTACTLPPYSFTVMTFD